MFKSKTAMRLLGVGLALMGVSGGMYWLFSRSGVTPAYEGVRVLSYSAFVNSWGPGPEIARRFQEEFKIPVELQDAGDAGLLIKKLDLFPADVVVGFDQLSLYEARKEKKWKPVDLGQDTVDVRWKEPEFLPFDWGPMTFIFRKGEIEPPRSFADLLQDQYRGMIALQDPRTSTPGLQFFFWVLDAHGVEGGFQFLNILKPNLHSVSGSWSAAYGLFTKKQAKLAFSYLTSAIYHWVEDKDESYQPAVFEEGHPVQVEYAGVPEACHNCEGGRQFALFLLRPEIQKIIMEKNYMMPVVPSVSRGTKFEKLPDVKIYEWQSLPELLNDREKLLDRWRKLGL